MEVEATKECNQINCSGIIYREGSRRNSHELVEDQNKDLIHKCDQREEGLIYKRRVEAKSTI